MINIIKKELEVEKTHPKIKKNLPFIYNNCHSEDSLHNFSKFLKKISLNEKSNVI